MGRLISVSLLVLAAVMGGALWAQRQASGGLRGEIVLLREERAELVRLRAENQRLVAAHMPANELARLRGDHAAVMGLHSEIEKLRESFSARERVLAERKAVTARGSSAVK